MNESSQDVNPPLMATLSEPSATAHPSHFQKTQNMSGLSVTTVAHGPMPSFSSSNLYHGCEQTTKLCAHFISHLFTCLDVPLPSSTQTPMLAYFIAMALWTHGNHQEHMQQCIPPSSIGWSAVEPLLSSPFPSALPHATLISDCNNLAAMV
jgi:hypothetical protein